MGSLLAIRMHSLDLTARMCSLLAKVRWLGAPRPRACSLHCLGMLACPGTLAKLRQISRMLLRGHLKRARVRNARAPLFRGLSLPGAN